MTMTPRIKRLAFFTRLLDTAPAAERYRLAAEQIAHAERSDTTRRGSPSTISMSMRAGCRRHSCFSAISRRAPIAFVLAPGLSRCRWNCRCGWPRTPSCWT